jgi:hypothetical protein
VHLDYVGPILDVSGKTAALPPLAHAVIAQAVADQQYLAYKSVGDLGGFVPAPTGLFAASSGGHNLVGLRLGVSQIPQFAQAANGKVNSFAAVGSGSFSPPDQGTSPIAGLGTPPPVTPPGNNNTVPPPNQGFGGTPPPNPPPTTTTEPTPPATTTTRTTAPPPTTGPTTTTTTTTTTPTTTTTAGPPTTTETTTTGPTTTTTTTTTPPFVGASCGTTGLTITSDHSTCLLHAVNMAPGGSVSEVMAIRNDTSQTLTLSLRADGTQNQLWQDLRLGVWEANTAAPSPLPPLLFWTGQDNTLTTLAPGETIRYELELLLPSSAGNNDQGVAVTIDLVWKAQG